MNDETAWIDAIQQAPEDESQLLAYADWLQARGDARGEYLRLLVNELPRSAARLQQLEAFIPRAWQIAMTGYWDDFTWMKGFPDEIGFLRAIERSPTDTALILVYADWLDERGDIRAEYLRLLQIPKRLRRLAPQTKPGWLALIRRRCVRARLRVARGMQLHLEYTVCAGQNYIGRAHPSADIDLDPQERPERVWVSSLHALIVCSGGDIAIEDLNSACGTYVERTRVYPGQRRILRSNDLIMMGNTQMRVIA